MPTELWKTDILTKALGGNKFETLRTSLKIVSLDEFHWNSSGFIFATSVVTVQRCYHDDLCLSYWASADFHLLQLCDLFIVVDENVFVVYCRICLLVISDATLVLLMVRIYVIPMAKFIENLKLKQYECLFDFMLQCDNYVLIYMTVICSILSTKL